MNRIIDHISSVYGFEIVPPSSPKSDLQYYKRSLYLFIKKNISEKAFYFLQDKFPIRYESSRPDSVVWMKRKTLDRTTCEVQIKPIPPEVASYHTKKRLDS